MTLIPWRKDFEIGIESVDHEHRELIDLINELHGNLQGDARPEIVDGFLGEIYARISAHFALEEKTMRDMRYGGYETHKTAHEELLDDIRDIMDAYEAGDYLDLDETLAQHLELWFGEHFRTEDARLHTFLEDERG